MERERRWRWLSGALAVAGLVVGVGCGEEPSGPTTEDFAREREAAKERAALTAKAEEKKREANRIAAEAATEQESAAELGSGNVDLAFSYDPTGKRDPFRSFRWERPDRAMDVETAGPLQQFDVNQLEVVAVVWHTGNARALVIDPSGESYIVAEGTLIGKNQGHVVSIGDNSVVVKETYVDYLGQETTKDVEMRVRRNEGG